MFGSKFKAAKCKSQLQSCVQRSGIMQSRRSAVVSQMKGEIADLLRSGRESEALIKVERLLQEEGTVTAYEIIAMFCQTVCGQLTLIDATKSCPMQLKGPIASIMYAAPICGDLPELQEVKTMFTAKYGKEFAAAAAGLRVDCGVDSRVVQLLSVSPPSSETKLRALERIATEHHVAWKRPSFEGDSAIAPTPQVSAFRHSSPNADNHGSNHGTNHPDSLFPTHQPSSPDRPQSTSRLNKPRINPESYPGARDKELHPPPSPLSVLRTHPSGNEHFGGVENKSPRGGVTHRPVGAQDSFSSSGSVATPRTPQTIHERRFEPGEGHPGTHRGADEGRFDPGSMTGGSERYANSGNRRSPPSQLEENRHRAMAKALETAAQSVVVLAQAVADGYQDFTGGGQFQGGNGPPQQNGGSRVANWEANQNGGEDEYRRRPESAGGIRYNSSNGDRAGDAFQQPGYEIGASRTREQSGGRERDRGDERTGDRNHTRNVKRNGDLDGLGNGTRNGSGTAFGSPSLDGAASQFRSDRAASSWQGEKTLSPRRLRGSDDGGFREGLSRGAAGRPATAPKRAESGGSQNPEQRPGMELGRQRTPRGTVFDSFEADSLSEGESRPSVKAPGGSRPSGGLKPRSPVVGVETTPGLERSPSPHGDNLSFAFPPPPPVDLDLPSTKFPVKSARVLAPPPKRSDDRHRFFKAAGSPRQGHPVPGDPFDLPSASPDPEVDELAVRMGALRSGK